MPADDLYPPVGYSWWIPGTGVLLLVLAVGWWVLVLWSTRRRTPAGTPTPTDAPPDPAPTHVDPYRALRDAHLALIDDVARRSAAGELTNRAAHLELDTIARSFATARTGTDMTVLTVREISSLGGADRMGALLDRLSPGAFAPQSKRTVTAAVQRTRQVVDTW